MIIHTHASIDELSDAELEQQTIRFLRTHLLTIIKAPIIGMMAGISALTFSGSISKALIIAIAAMLLSGFTTWRRFLEPLGFWLLVASVIYWCDQEIVTHLKIAARALATM